MKSLDNPIPAEVIMGKVLLLYHSDSGNTANMAQYVAEAVRSVENTQLRFKTIDEANAEDLRWCDGLALGSPTNLGTVSWRMKRGWDDLPQDLWSTIDGKFSCALFQPFLYNYLKSIHYLGPISSAC